jgi:hypothetical protein
MAINIPIVTEFVDTGLKSAQGAFDTFRTKVGEAEGGMGKLKAGAGVAFDSIKANAGNLAMVAGGAIAGFAAKAIGDFQDLALSVDNFRDKTNLTLDQSSRWNAYTSDLGIESDAMVKIFDKLGKGATDQIPAFQELGVEIAFGPDGTTDIEETFFRVIDKLNSLEDPAARAKLQAELFGKGWMSAAEIINSSSSDIKRSLEDVGDFEIIDEEEIQKAKDLREAQDRLGDALAELSVNIGEKLIPALTDATEAAIPFLDAIGPLVDLTFDGADANSSYAEQISKSNSQMRIGWSLAEKLANWIGIGNDETEEMAETVDQDLVKAWEGGYRAMIDAQRAAEDLTEEFINVDDALAELKGNVDERQAWRNLQDDIDKVKEAAITAFTEATPEALRDSEAALDNARLKVGEYITSIDGIPEDQKTEFIANLDQANIQQIEAMLAYLARAREIPFMPVLAPGVGGIGEIGSGGRPIGEAPISLGRGNRMAVGGVTVNVAGSVVTERDLVNSVRKGLIDSQRNGAPLVYSNS